MLFKLTDFNLSQGRKFLLNGHKVVEFASLNSCLLQQVQNQFQGIGYVGEAQLNSMATNLGWSNNEGVKIPKKNGVIRIAMLHHHLTPVNEVEDALLDARYSVTLDAERIMRWIVKHKVDYVLHGHMHKCNSITITRKVDSLQPTSSENPEHTFKIISLGSSGVKYEDLPGQDSANYVGVIDFSGEKPSFKFFKLNKQTEPETSPTYTVEG
ncbi:hypothetical protein B0W48_07325 [Pseudoalteromonas aliena]|uniref:Calcineurin-like phosphoesterase domain-containing protein n=1 Tax=Pseudoalteromonas aliena TaxID=247523 RepID=A0A1Q2GX10_9GAMM|nr:metallophosphoesterase [Pseudoalteromonas aliena]AQP99626.1 hypothetical protein B0W48_07325 [Pseudoalteromonas aliena]